MSGTRVRMRDEGDIDEDDAAPPAAQGTHAGLGDMAEPVDGRPPPPARQQTREQGPPLEVVEVGEDGRPVDARYRETTDDTVPPAQDQRLHDDRQETFVEQGERQGRRPRESTPQRTRRLREARDRAFQENNQLRQQLADQEARLAELQQQVGGIEPRLAEFDRGRAQQQLGDLDRQIAEQKNFARIARDRIAEASNAGDGKALAEALEARDEALIATNQIQVRRNMLASGNPFGDVDQRQPARHQQHQPPPQQQAIQPQPMLRAVRERISEFTEDHPWYQLVPRRMPDGSVQNVPADLESKIMWTIDNEVANEGFDPSTDDYWDEIRERGRQFLPHRFGAQTQRQLAPRQNGNGNGRYEEPMPRAQQRQPEARGPRVGGGSDRAPGPRANQVYISPGRKEALIAAGALGRDGRTIENRTLYDKYVSGYAKYDRENAVTA
jgi:hypothetical protein